MTEFNKEFMRSLYEAMLRIRSSEECLVDPIERDEIRCPCHLCSGQEAVAAGVCATLEPEDFIFGNHRSHGHYIAKGGDLASMFAEIYGKSDGCSGGRGGSMHVIDIKNGMLGAAPIVGGTISLALGVALASKIRGDDRVTVSFFGDGSTGEGVLYESMNFAALKKLPLMFVCENNLYSTHMSIRECRVKNSIYDVAKPFGILSRRIDGNDVLKVYETAKVAADHCRKGKGPVFIECLTYRMRGHVGPDDNVQGTRTDIRPKEEISKWKRKDPIKRLGRFMLKNGLVTKSELNEMERSISDQVARAHELAKGSNDPEEGDLTKYVFKQ